MPRAESAKFRQATVVAAIALGTTVFVYATPGWAAKVYRCGNAFQDQPCPEPKPAEQRAADRPAASRDTAPCASIGKEVTGRSECIVRSSTRDTQAAAVVEAKR